jgi:succinate dehydrogenase / fumarate reductase membrane anchor subunit
MRTPLSRAIGLGSAKEGVDHWWAERIGGLALVPLTVWFVIAVIQLIGADRAAFVEWVRHPVPAVLLVLLLIATFHHNAHGLQVVIEDYVENETLRFGLIIIIKLASIVLAVLGIFAVLKLSFAG